MKNDQNIEYLIGKKAKLNIYVEPFSSQIISFLNDLSQSLDNNFNNKNFPDLKALSFFCRKKNILSLKNKYQDKDSARFGLGLLFHITPSNIPTNFAYSLIFGLISGNSNVVKVPSKKFNEIDIICKSINYVLNKKKYMQVKNMIAIIRYSNKDILTKKFSAICDARLIWGGDKTINNIKKFDTKAKNIDIPFADRYSISLINSEKFLKLPEYKVLNLVNNFYNDTYVVDQNACSSPHLILWKGRFYIKAKKKFWQYLNNVVKKKYNSPLISTADNYSRLAADVIKNKNIHSYKSFNKSLYVVTLKKLYPNLFIQKPKWGFFYECNIKNLKNISFVINRGLQTLTYFGFSKQFVKTFFKSNNFNGIDRVVPFGQALNINLIWDGYDLTKILSRKIEIR
tara:strand:- start:22620 stop:23813 length:1194 start_codon:yes stop_codon:yes gene_type:complete